MPFKTLTIKPLTGIFDTLSASDEIGFGNWRLVKNATTRSSRNRQVAGGFRRLFAQQEPYNNQDLHDQLTDHLGYYDSFLGHAMGGGSLAGYLYQYFFHTDHIPAFDVWGTPAGPYAPFYYYELDGLYNGCPIFYPFVGFPYQLVPAQVPLTSLVAHYRFEESSTSPRVDVHGGLNLTASVLSASAPGVIHNALVLNSGEFCFSNDAAFQVGDIVFGFTGWLNSDVAMSNQVVLSRWGSGTRQYRVKLENGYLKFDVSSGGGPITGTITSAHNISAGQWYFFAAWHDSVANTVNIRINDNATESVSYAGGVVATFDSFIVGTDNDFGEFFKGKIDSLSFWKTGFPNSGQLTALYHAGMGLDYPFQLDASAPNTGSPDFWLYSFVYAACPTHHNEQIVPGYPYGPTTPIYSAPFAYDYVYCGNGLYHRQGCREAVTTLGEIVTAQGRKLVAATLSRIYEADQSTGTWRILADGLGNAGYTVYQCGCNAQRGMFATMGGYLLWTNGFDPPASYFLGDETSGCDLTSLKPISDLDALGITSAGGVVVWKGFAILYDIVENAERMGGTLIWSDLENPNSFIESDTSFAGRATVAIGETILNAAPLGNWLILYTDKSILRVTLVGGDDVFNFERIYEGGNALKYKFSLVNAGDQHLYLGESDVYIFTQFDTRPLNAPWITKAAGMIFNGIAEDDATYAPLNKEACNLVTGFWSDETHEAFISWPTGSNQCPDVTLRFNLKYNAADLLDHGFTAGLTFRNDIRPTVGQWMEDLGICPRGTMTANDPKHGPVCPPTASPVENPPLYIRNPEENPDLPVHPRSLCATLAGKSMLDFCEDCAAPATLIAASAEDFALKQLEDEIYYRELLGGNVEDYDAYACLGQYYHYDGYDTVMQTGLENYRTDDEKMMKRLVVEAEPNPASTPATLTGYVAYAVQSNCVIWRTLQELPFECLFDRTRAEYVTAGIRPDSDFRFATWARGRFLGQRFKLTGIAGGGLLSAMSVVLTNWGQAESP